MTKWLRQIRARGPFREDQLRPGDPYELSNGHPILCLPKGGRKRRAVKLGGAVLASDPAAQDVGVDVGFSPSPEILRAPDLAVGDMPDAPGWVHDVPPLAVEYADTGQDEAELWTKIQELFSAGTRFVWVVRLTGPRRVEVHQPNERMRIANPGEQLLAPGILANPVPVEALYDREAANRVIFKNLLERQGYGSLDDVRAEGQAEGEIEGLRKAILVVIEGRGLLWATACGQLSPTPATPASSNPPSAGRRLVQLPTRSSPPSGLKPRSSGLQFSAWQERRHRVETPQDATTNEPGPPSSGRLQRSNDHRRQRRAPGKAGRPLGCNASGTGRGHPETPRPPAPGWVCGYVLGRLYPHADWFAIRIC